nr:ABC transporter permease subunit [Rhizobium sp. L1K21]
MLWQVFVVVIVLLGWFAGNHFNVFNRDVIPPMTDVAYQFIAAWARPEFLPAIWSTLSDALMGIFFAAVLAVPLGLLIGSLRAVEIATRTLLDFGRAFPVVALLPIFVLLIGANSAMKIVTIAIACFFPILLQTIYGVRRQEPVIVDTVRSFRIPHHLRFFRVLLPSALPYIATGIRIAATVSILVAVGTEVIMPVPGVGRQISVASINDEVALAFAYVIYAGFLGVILTTLWEIAEERMLPWARRTR